MKQKQERAARAGDLYTSQLFRRLRCYAEKHADVWYILSAEYGVLRPEEVVEPYERTLNKMPRAERAQWAARVQQQLAQRLPAHAEIILLAGMRYREGIEPFLRNLGLSVSVPLEGLKIGEQLQRLKRDCSMDSARRDLERFYSLLTHLFKAPGQGRPLRELPGPACLPARGVYFFTEPGESRGANPSIPRIVRVGTHAIGVKSRSTLHARLKQHLGARTGGGNHRGSIFRLHVGAALLARDSIQLTTWGVGSSKPAAVRDCVARQTAESDCERRVSEHIGAMSVLWIDVPDEPGPQSDRAFIERNAIALLSNRLEPIDFASAGWLGGYSPRHEIRESALWNLNHVAEACNVTFLDKLESFVALTCKRGGR